MQAPVGSFGDTENWLAILFIQSRQRASYIAGQLLVVDGG